MLITDEDINYAENLLLADGQYFDDERRDFIKNMKTIDLQAVPGSGKTTALLAKLVILETKLPLQGGAGILVLSHTNTAIDEIKHRIQCYCPKLFAYPNFIGTIQSFVDTFLAIPYYSQILGKKIITIDTERYEDELVKYYHKLAWNRKYNQFSKLLYSRHINKAKEISNGNQALTKKIVGDLIEDEVKGLGVESISEKIVNRSGKTILSDKKNPRYEGLKLAIQAPLIEGFISYEIAYDIALDFMRDIPPITHILQKRFNYVFVDEMQDMGERQYLLIEKLFYENDCVSILQRIGDINQSIYSSGKNNNNFIWQQREITLPLANSHRLSPNISNIVNRLAVSTIHYDVQGNNHNAILRPHILCFNNDTIKKVIPFFSRLVHQYHNQEKLPNFGRKPIKAIAWNVEWKDDEASRNDTSKLRLEDYVTSFNTNANRPKIDYKCLKEYLIHYPKDTNTLAPIRKNILNAFIKILRIENIKDNSPDSSRFYTKRKLLGVLKEKNIELYDKIKFKIYKWSIGIVEGHIDDVLGDIRSFIPELLDFFECSINKCQNFIADENVIKIEDTGTTLQSNCYCEDGFEIDITSVHSVKGQTHCATLYLESYYHDYESKKLKRLLLGGAIDLTKSRQVEASKMMYVGFSRPMDFLCFAVHENRLNGLRENLANEWEIIDIEV